MTNRISWDEYFMRITEIVAKRSTCNKIEVGCIIVKNRLILSTGYNGAPKGMPHCIDVGCLIYNNHCIRSLHAEVNAIIQCASSNMSTKGSYVYVTHLPCWQCSLMLINAEVEKIFYANDYVDDRGNQLELLKKANIKVIKIGDKNE